MVVLGRGVMLVNVVRFDMATIRKRIQEEKKTMTGTGEKETHRVQGRGLWLSRYVQAAACETCTMRSHNRLAACERMIYYYVAG